MRIPLRSISTLVMAIGVATCADTPSTAVTTSAAPGHGIGRISLVPVFSKAAQYVAAHMADFGVTFDSVRVVIVRPVADTVKDTTVFFAPGSPDVTLNLTVDVKAPGEAFTGDIDYTNANGVVFHGEAKVQSYSPGQPVPPQGVITIEYKGAGANVDHIVVAPKTTSVVSPNTAPFTVTAFDATNVAVPFVPINWTSSDLTVATISNTGTLKPTGKRGTVTVTATTITGKTDNGVATITLPPASMVLVSGGGQTGKAGAALAQPGVVRVLATDGLGVAGVTVNFAAPTGGKVGAASVTTDANGQASTVLTLGGTAGPQGFAATAAGFSVPIPETATAADPSVIAVVSGSGQTDTVKHALKLPFVVKVTDAFGNPVGGVTVNWARTAGAGTVSAATSVTGPDGLTSIGYTLGATVGNESISATVAGVGVAAVFTAQAVSAGPASIVIVSGNAQVARVTQALGVPLVVKVTDDANNPVVNGTIAWTAANGTVGSPTTTTDAAGQSSNTMTLGTVAGNASATATINGKSVIFTATAQAGIVAQAVFKVEPPNGAPGVVLAPAIQVALLDAQGNATAAVNAVTVALGANPGTSVLAGTLTRNAVAGVATFNDLSLNNAGVGYTLVASSAGVANVTSVAFNIGGGGPNPNTMFIFGGDGQTAAVNTAVPVVPAVKISDPQERPVAGASVTFTPAGGSGVAAPAVAVLTNQNGVAALNSWTLGILAGAQTLVASSPGLPDVTFHATATAGPPSDVKFQNPFPGAGIAGQALGPVVTVAFVDRFGNIVKTEADNITVTITPGTGALGASLLGANTVAAVAGVAAFPALAIDKAAAGYTLTSATPVAGVLGGVSGPITIVADAGNRYVLTAPTVTPAVSATQVVTAQFSDAFNNPIATPAPRNVNWTLAGAGSIGVTPSATNAAGQAVINYTAGAVAGIAGTVTATDAVQPVITGAVTFVPNAGGGALLAVTTPPPGAIADRAALGQIVVSVQDANHNPVSAPGVSVTPTLTAAPQGGTLVGGAAVNTDASGNATFNGLSFSGPVGAYTITFAANGLTPAVANVTVTPGAVAQMKITQQPTTAGISSPISPAVTITALDADNNLVIAQPINVAANITAGTGTAGAVLGGGGAIATAAGVATFPNLAIDKAGVGYKLDFTTVAQGVAKVTSAAFDIVAPSAIAIVAQPLTVTNDAVFAIQPQVKLVNAGVDVHIAGITVTATAVNLPTPTPPISGNAVGRGRGAAPPTRTPVVPGRPPVSTVVRPGTGVSINPTDGRRGGRGGGNPGAERNFNLVVTAGNTAVTDANGVATFVGMKVKGTVQAFQLSFTANVPGVGALSVNSANIAATPGAATNIIAAAGDGQTALAAAPVPIPPIVQLVDVSANPTSAPLGTNITFVADGGGTVNSPVATDANGQATTPWTLPAALGPAHVTASATLGGLPVSVIFTAVSAQVAGMAGAGFPAAVNNGVKLNPITIQLTDGAGGHPLARPGVNITVSVVDRCDCATPTAGGTLTRVTGANGAAVFDDLVLTGNGVTFALRFSAAPIQIPGLDSPDISYHQAQAPANIVAVGPTTTSTPVGTPLAAPNYPKVKVLDANATPIQGTHVDIYPEGGPCLAAGGTQVTDANGQVALGPQTLTVPVNAAASCLLQIVASDADINSVEFAIVVAPGGMVTWLGTTGTDWAVAANWTPRAPLATDNVYIPENILNLATLSAPATIASLTEESIENIAEVNVGAFQLTVNGDLILNSDQGIVGTGGSVLLTKPGAGLVQGNMFAPVTVGAVGCAGGTSYKLAANTGMFGNVTVNCPLDLGALALVASADLVVQNAGSIKMIDANSALNVSGNATFDGASEVGLMTNGALLVGKDLTAGGTHSPTAFFNSGTFTTVFASGGGPAQHLIHNAGATPGLQSIAVLPTSQVVFTANETIAGDFTVGFGGATVKATGFTITVNGLTTGGDLSGITALISTNATLPQVSAAPALTTLQGAVTLIGASNFPGALTVAKPLSMHGFALTVTGALVIDGAAGTGTLVTTGATDHLTVGGKMTVLGTAAAGTSGYVDLQGDLEQSQVNPTFFQNMDSVRFVGGGAHAVHFANPGHVVAFKKLTLKDPGAVTMNSDLVVKEADLLNGSHLTMQPNWTLFVSGQTPTDFKIHGLAHLTFNSPNGTGDFVGVCRKHDGSGGVGKPTIDGTNLVLLDSFAHTCTEAPLP